MSVTDSPEVRAAIAHCTVERETDMLSYSGPIYAANVNRFIAFDLGRRRRKNIALLMTTFGGDADAAYRLARYLQGFYEHIRLYIVGPCKSAGTLVTLCADELVFGPFGELGPLDMQIAKKDDLVAMVSGLDTFQALSIIKDYAFKSFQEYMYEIIEGSGGAISTQTAGEFAGQLVTGLFQPLMSQLDPQRMGEVQRLIDIAKAYGERLNRKNLKEDSLRRLIEAYPSHTFIIDYQEASTLFKNVEQITAEEMTVMLALQQSGACITQPSHTIMLRDVSTLLPESQETEDEAPDGIIEDTGADVQASSDGVQADRAGNGSRSPARSRRKGSAPPPPPRRAGGSNGGDVQT